MHSSTWVLPKETFTARMSASCLCGAVNWSYDDPFAAMFHCHCSMCRKHHGALFVTWLVGPLSTFHWRGGTEQIVTWRSSANGARSFCSACGTTVPTVDSASGRTFLPAGSFDGEPGIRPQMHIFVASKSPFVQIADGLPEHAEFPPGFGTGLPTPVRRVRDGVTAGSCGCGRILFELTGRPLVMRHCHCSRCRHARAAAHATNLAYPLDAIRFVAGEELLVDFPLPGTQHFGQAFCSACGSAMPRRSPGRGFVVVPIGALDSDPGIHPSAHQFVAFKAPWYDIHDGVPQFGESGPLPVAPGR
jgi:hypothetical protein